MPLGAGAAGAGPWPHSPGRPLGRVREQNGFFLYEGAELRSWGGLKQPGEAAAAEADSCAEGFLPLVSPGPPAPVLPLACSLGSRHFVLKEEFELLRSDVWLRCEIFVKGHVAEIDFKTDLFQLKVMLLELSESSGITFIIICGRLKLSR